jgi:exodeoxyribonuclease V alpha subunit
MENAITITGVIKKLVYNDIQTGYTVFTVFYDNKYIAFAGTTANLPDEVRDIKIKVTGKFKYNKKYGTQFEFSEYQLMIETAETALIGYLSSHVFKGIGDNIAKKIYETFGKETLDIVDNKPEELIKVKGIGKKKLEVLINGIKVSQDYKSILMFFKPYQFSDYQIKVIYEKFGINAINIAKVNPYKFTEIKGIGFKKADIMAAKLGIPKNDENRILFGTLYAIIEFCYNLGHTYITESEINKEISEIMPELAESEKHITYFINKLLDDNKIIIEDKNNNIISAHIASISGYKIYPKTLYEAEMSVTKELYRIYNSQTAKINTGIINSGDIMLTEQQESAVIKAVSNNFSVISGGPGTGKSTIIKKIYEIFKNNNLSVALTSLSGKATARLSGIINGFQLNDKISTIHRLLGTAHGSKGEFYNFLYNENKKLPYDAIIIDEISMVDINMFLSLLKAIKNGAFVILVGDANQLPSIGPGNILKDIINTNIFPVTFLTKIFRQAEGGFINLNAYNLLNNQKFITGNNNTSGGFLIKYKKEYDIKEKGKDFLYDDFKNMIESIRNKRKQGFDDIQILTPMRKGTLGYNNLNTLLQSVFNEGDKDSFIANGITYKIDDRIIQIRNNYNDEVFNGDGGFITKINHNNKTVTVIIDGKEVIYSFLEAQANISLAYALSIHKSQGSEFDNVIIIFHQSQFTMLKKSILYTAITRAKKNVVLFGTYKAFWIAQKAVDETRNSALTYKIKQAFLPPA